MEYNIFVLFTFVMLYLYYQSDYKRKECLSAIFVAMWVIFSIEFYTTKDYAVYYEGFSNTSYHVLWEPLYRLLLKIFQPFGFVFFNSCVAAFEIFTLYVLLKRIVPPQYRWIAILILVLNTFNLFLFMNLKRQFFAMIVAAWVLYFIIYSKHRYRYYFAAIAFLCSINIHSSAFMAVVYFVLPFCKKRMNLIACSVVMVVYLSSFALKLSTFTDEIFQLMEISLGDDDRYGDYVEIQEEYEDKNIAKALFSQIYEVMMIVLLLLFNKKFTDEQYKFALLGIFGIILMNVLKGDFHRLYFYYTIYLIYLAPVVVGFLREYRHKWICYCVLLLMLAIPAKSYYNAMFGGKVTYMTIKYKHFYTIFDDNPDKREYLFD